MNKKTYIIAFFFFLTDLISKQLIMHFLILNKSIKVITNFFYLTYCHNDGAAWSILKDQRIMLLILTVLVLFIIHKFLNKEKTDTMENIVYGMIIGGILGNFYDRLVYGYVIDFLDFKIFGYNYPVFNFADIFIVVGIITMIIISIRKEHVCKK
jgi:signal peptidase II